MENSFSNPEKNEVGKEKRLQERKEYWEEQNHLLELIEKHGVKRDRIIEDIDEIPQGMVLLILHPDFEDGDTATLVTLNTPHPEMILHFPIKDQEQYLVDENLVDKKYLPEESFPTEEEDTEFGHFN